MKKKQLIIFIVLLIFINIVVFLNFAKKEKESVWIGEKQIEVEVVETPEEKAQGLSGREKLCADCGMLFILDKSEKYSFWMKGMVFDLDFIWINGNKVVKINRDISHIKGEKEIIQPGVIVDKVVEVNAGKIVEWGIEEGDKVFFDIQ